MQFRTGMSVIAVPALIAIAGLSGCNPAEQSASSPAASSGSGAGQTQQVAGSNAAPAVAQVDMKAPDFTLADLNGTEHTLSDYTAKGHVVVLEWFNPQCPFVVKQYDADYQVMNELAAEYADQKVTWLRINSGAPGQQGHGMDLNRQTASSWGIDGPILIDESGAVGRKYDAKTTPHMYVIDAEGMLRYAGAIDKKRRANDKPTESDATYVEAALEAIMSGEDIADRETQAYGCSVKYAS